MRNSLSGPSARVGGAEVAQHGRAVIRQVRRASRVEARPSRSPRGDCAFDGFRRPCDCTDRGSAAPRPVALVAHLRLGGVSASGRGSGPARCDRLLLECASARDCRRAGALRHGPRQQRSGDHHACCAHSPDAERIDSRVGRGEHRVVRDCVRPGSLHGRNPRVRPHGAGHRDRENIESGRGLGDRDVDGGERTRGYTRVPGHCLNDDRGPLGR
jgi:hypothetical protein